MSALICEDCFTKFPMGHARCPVCQGPVYWEMNARPDRDWQDKVAEAELKAKRDYSLSKEAEWRRDQLLQVGYSDTQALFIALAREIDLHEARTLASKAGPDLAFQILS